MSRGNKKRYFNTGIGLCIGLIPYLLLKPSGGLTQTGINVLAVFAMLIYWWITVGTTWTTVIVIPLVALTGVMSDTEAIAVGMGNNVTLFIMMSGMMNTALLKSGCIHRFILWFITRRIVKNRPYLFLLLYMTAIYLVSLVMVGTTVCIMLLPIIKEICDELGYGEEDRFTKTLYMLANWVSLLGFVATPIGHSTAMMCIASIESLSGYHMSFGQYMSVGVPISLVWFVLIYYTVRYFYKIDTQKFVYYDLEDRRKKLEDMGRLNERQKLTVLIFFVCVLMFFVPDLLAVVFPGLKRLIDKIGAASILILGISAMSLIEIDGQPLLDFKTAASGIEWGPVFMNTAMCAVSGAVTAERAGITVWIQNVLSPLAGQMRNWVPFVLLVGSAMLILTQFMACRTIMLIGIMVALPIAAELGLNPVAIAVICCYTANMGLMSPPASGGASVIFSSGYMTSADGFRLGWYALPQGLLISLLAYAVIHVAIPF